LTEQAGRGHEGLDPRSRIEKEREMSFTGRFYTGNRKKMSELLQWLTALDPLVFFVLWTLTFGNIILV